MALLHLQQGIQFFDRDADMNVRQTRIWLSSGTVPAATISALAYRSEAFLPAEPWGVPSAHELELLQTEHIPSSPGTPITLVRLPDSTLRGFEQLGLADIATERDAQTLVKRKHYALALQEVLNYLEPFFLSHEKTTINPVITNPAGLQTVTFDYQRNCYIGLHLDSWDRLPLAQRHLSTTRLCINMGSEDRFLLFINLPLQTMFDVLPEDTEKELLRKHGGIGRLETVFIQHYPYYPVVKLRIAPGEAYIAPTENMIHDASTLGQTRIDVILTIRGYLGLSR